MAVRREYSGAVAAGELCVRHQGEEEDFQAPENETGIDCDMSVSGGSDRLSSCLMNCRFCPLANCYRGTGAKKKKDFRYKLGILWAVQLKHTLVDTLLGYETR
ncbi:hypothetical protein [Nostoc sphaeroides]|uniref:hypothetical protein n=1 Tax=Nostoc sphaeroides TaxID=446679 RepID=UPI00126A3CB8|nr:hypothetical protein [Nostoc sphaeroides]